MPKPTQKTEEIINEWHKFTQRSEITNANVIEALDDAEDFWLQKMSEQKERLIKEVDNLSFSDVQAKKGWTGLKETIKELIQK